MIVDIQPFCHLGEFAEEDEKYGEEHRERRREMRLINDFFTHVSWKDIRHFNQNKLLPCPKPYITIEVFCKEYNDEQNQIAKEMKQCRESGGTWKFKDELYSTEHIRYHSFDDFWKRWKRFRKVKSIL